MSIDTPLSDEMRRSPNPEYDNPRVDNSFPFRVAAEMIGATAGRLYLREQNRLICVTMSDLLMQDIATCITEALDEGHEDE